MQQIWLDVSLGQEVPWMLEEDVSVRVQFLPGRW